MNKTSFWSLGLVLVAALVGCGTDGGRGSQQGESGLVGTVGEELNDQVGAPHPGRYLWLRGGAATAPGVAENGLDNRGIIVDETKVFKEVTTYYNAIGAPQTFQAWLDQYGFPRRNPGEDLQAWRDRAKVAVYYNENELGLGRELGCAKYTDTNGQSGYACFVSNYGDTFNDRGNSILYALNGIHKKNTVAINYRPSLPAGTQVEFYVYAEDGTRQNWAALDLMGRRSVPHICTNCHGGQYDSTRHLTDGARFFPINPTNVRWGDDYFGTGFIQATFGVGATKNGQRDRARWMNGVAMNTPLTENQVAWLTAYYQGDPRTVTSWTDKPSINPKNTALNTDWTGRTELYNKIISPYCGGCHFQLSAGTTDFLAQAFGGWTGLSSVEKWRLKRNVCGSLRQEQRVDHKTGAYEINVTYSDGMPQMPVTGTATPGMAPAPSDLEFYQLTDPPDAQNTRDISQIAKQGGTSGGVMWRSCSNPGLCHVHSAGSSFDWTKKSNLDDKNLAMFIQQRIAATDARKMPPATTNITLSSAELGQINAYMTKALTAGTQTFPCTVNSCYSAATTTYIHPAMPHAQPTLRNFSEPVLDSYTAAIDGVTRVGVSPKDMFALELGFDCSNALYPGAFSSWSCNYVGYGGPAPTVDDNCGDASGGSICQGTSGCFDGCRPFSTPYNGYRGCPPHEECVGDPPPQGVPSTGTCHACGVLNTPACQGSGCETPWSDSANYCIACRTDADCAGGRRCNVTTGYTSAQANSCVECLTNSQCRFGQTCNPKSHSCTGAAGSTTWTGMNTQGTLIADAANGGCTESSSTITGPGTATSVTGVEIGLSVLHTYRGDLEIILVPPSPFAQRTVYPRNVPWDGNDNIFMNVPVSLVGTSKVAPNNVWTLKVRDCAGGDVGKFNWRLALNTALNQPELLPSVASLSSAFSSNNVLLGRAENANDGNTNGYWQYDFGLNSVAHSGDTANPWARLDFGMQRFVDFVELYNRLDCCGDRSQSLDLQSSNDGTNFTTAGTIDGTELVNTGRTITPVGKRVRYLRVRQHNQDYLNLAEIVPWGTP